jgi:hypothetical protein
MNRWEYQITRYRLQDFAKKDEVADGAFFCDQKGQCFLHDTSQGTDMVRDVLNGEGEKGWELVQFGYHLGEMICLWKRLTP